MLRTPAGAETTSANCLCGLGPAGPGLNGDSSAGAAGQAEAELEGPPAAGQAITGCLKSPGSCILSVMILKQRESPVHSTGLAAPRPQPAHHAGMAAGTRTGSHRRQQHQLVKSEPGSVMEGEVPAAGLQSSLAAAQTHSKSLLLRPDAVWEPFWLVAKLQGPGSGF